jgi:CRP/FNR family cyclic AMP-dependent transcriptional regulator
MSLQEEVEILRRIPLFAKLEPARLKLIAFTSQRLAYAAGQVLFSQGEPGDSAYIVIAGEAEVAIAAEAGSLVVATIGRHAIIGEIAILCDVPRTATVTARTAMQALRIDKDTFFGLVTEFPEMAVAIMRELAQRLERTNQQLRAAIAARSH